MTIKGPSGQRPKVGLLTLAPYLHGQGSTLVAVAALSFAATGGTLAQPLLVRGLLDRLGASQPVMSYLGSLCALVLGTAVLYGVRNYLLQRTAEAVVLKTRQRLAGHLLRLPIAEYDRRRTGDLLSRVGADTSLLRTAVTFGLADLLTDGVVIVGAMIMMVVLDTLMFAVTVAGMVGMFGAFALARRIRGASEQTQARVGAMISAIERAITGVRTVRAARAEDRETAVVAESARQAYVAGLRMARLMSMVGPVGSMAIQGAFLAVLGVGGARVAAGTMGLGDLVAFVLFLFILMMPIMQTTGVYARLQAGLGALQRIEEVLALPIETASDAPAAIAAEPAGGTPAIEYDRVTFAYDGGEPVLREVSFAVPYRTRTAVVGPSGAGKSTLLALAERFYDTTAGTVRVAGLDVRDQPRDRLRANLGYVEQDAPVLAGTIRDNLLLTVPDATDEQLLAVLKAVNLAELTARTPEGLDAPVGEGGVLLSGGERQRLAIARTLLAAPPILLLDEPTSNLDARNEHALQQAIDAVANDRTVLVVAHRLSTVMDADQIVVLDGGRVVATGRHRELLDTSPLYRELVAKQLLATELDPPRLGV